jgi:alpha-ribazole phosphatase
MDLVLIRHSEPLVDAGVCYGQTDLPLRDDVAMLARAASARMDALGVPACERGWHTSPLRRCLSLAHALSGANGARIDTRLSEMDFGAWEGLRWNGIERTLIDSWAADILHARPHGGESLAHFAQRVLAWFDDVCAASSPSPVHVVSHAGVMRVLTAHVLGIGVDGALQWPLDFGGIVWLRRVAKRWVIVRWNA